MTNITIEEINRLSDLLNSDDPEMRDLGLIVCVKAFKISYYVGCSEETRLHTVKSILCSKAYRLGLEKGKQLKQCYDNRTSS